MEGTQVIPLEQESAIAASPLTPMGYTTITTNQDTPSMRLTAVGVRQTAQAAQVRVIQLLQTFCSVPG